MGILVPEHFPLSLLANDAERIVVEALRDRLTDGWLIIPNVGLTGDRDRQMDIVIAHEGDGIAVIEVKGHRAKIDRGVWMSDGRALDPQPLTQAKNNAYALRAMLRDRGGPLAHVRVEYAVAFPNLDQVIGSLPPDVDPSQVLTGHDLDAPADAIERLLTRRWGSSIGEDGISQLVAVLRPDAELRWDPDARARRARARLESICGDQVRALERLDTNRRVIVTGRAGTGKTRLAMAWARRAMVRGERVLLTCYNDPLGGEMQRRLPDVANLTVGSFYDVALALEGMPDLEIPDEADGTWWDTIAVGHLHSNWPKVTERYDVVIVDEAQDFSPGWLAQLATLLDPAGSRRMMMVADPQQGLYPRGFVMPAADDGWTMCELVNNCRNTSAIATMLRQRLGGAPAPVLGPESLDIGWVEADDLDTAAELAGDELDRILDGQGLMPPRVLFATFSSEVRDRLREDLGFVRWEGGEGTAVICETVHRVKGLEFDHVVLVATNNAIADNLLYVGVSRAITGLTVIGPKALAERLGLVP